MSILEFKDRPGEPLYHLEHFIEGEYIKYNSNSGFVDENLRYTPQVCFICITCQKSVFCCCCTCHVILAKCFKHVSVP